MGINVINLVLYPEQFFRQALGEIEQLRLPGLIILLGAAIAAVSGYLAGGLSVRMMEPVLQGMTPVIMVIAIIAAFFGTFVAWGVWAGVFYLLSRVFKGSGSYSRCLEVVGYGFVPQVIGMLVTVAAALVYLPKVAVPVLTTAAMQDPQMIKEATSALMHDPAMMAFTEITAVVSIVFLIWSATIWIFGLKQARNLSLKNAAICVMIPVILFIVLQAYSLTGA